MPDNFSAAYALLFCAGVFLPRKLAWWLPLGTMLATDVALNFYYQHRGYDAWKPAMFVLPRFLTCRVLPLVDVETFATGFFTRSSSAW